MDPYILTLAFVGAAILGAAVLPLLLAGRPLSFPIVYVALGMAVFALPLRLPTADPLVEGDVVERMTELAVIVSLMGAGLKIDRTIGWASWRTTRRLLVLAMPLTIAGVAILGWWAAGLAPAAALLLGAVLAPTDPVLAADVQVGPPGGEAEDEVRFGLTSEAGLNDGLAFPFTNAAIAMAAAGSAGVGSWLGGWVLDDVLLKLGIGLTVGLAGGRAVGAVLFRLPTTRRIAESTEGFVSLATTLLVYGVAELCHGYGFVAVFVAAYVLRHHERDHEYHEVLHASSESIERLVSAALLVLLGAPSSTAPWRRSPCEEPPWAWWSCCWCDRSPDCWRCSARPCPRVSDGHSPSSASAGSAPCTTWPTLSTRPSSPTLTSSGRSWRS